VADYQIFNINIVEADKNSPPVIERNTGLDYLLYQTTPAADTNNQPGQLIMRNDLLISDRDDPDSDIFVEITRKPAHGRVEHTQQQRGLPLHRFSQEDINANRVMYVLSKQSSVEDEGETDAGGRIYEDYFEFDVRDSSSNVVRSNRFQITWSAVRFEEQEVSVMESEGKVRVHVQRVGNVRRYAAVTCRTVADTATSSHENHGGSGGKQFDFVHTSSRVEFNEDERLKACDVTINRDQVTEGIESFYIVLEEARYTVIGQEAARVKVNILDKAAVVETTMVEFEKTVYAAHESDKFVSLVIVRSGEDLSGEVAVDCVTRAGEALAELDYVPRGGVGGSRAGHVSQVRIPSGEVYGFCDVELVDDDLNEPSTETFSVVLVNASPGVRVGARSEAIVSIMGPNDGNDLFNFFF
jgi:hypothetical protein